jgi:hypothetical protein
MGGGKKKKNRGKPGKAESSFFNCWWGRNFGGKQFFGRALHFFSRSNLVEKSKFVRKEEERERHENPVSQGRASLFCTFSFSTAPATAAEASILVTSATDEAVVASVVKSGRYLSAPPEISRQGGEQGGEGKKKREGNFLERCTFAAGSGKL